MSQPHPMDKFRDYIAEEHKLSGEEREIYNQMVKLSRDPSVDRTLLELKLTSLLFRHEKVYSAFYAYLDALISPL